MRPFACLVACWFMVSAAHAETFPSKPIRMIVPFPAGSATDGQARLIGAHFQKVFGHGFIVENMPGATGAIAARTIARAAPDGYTLMISSVSTHSANAYLYSNLGYDPIADFTPVALIARAPYAMVVRAETPYPDAAGFRRLRQGQSRQAQFRLRQHGQPRGRRDAQCVRRDQDHRGLLSRNAAGDDRSARRTDRFRRDGCVADPGAHQGRQAAHARGHRHRPHGDVSRCADHDRSSAIRISCCIPGRACTGPPGMPPEIVATLNQAIRDAVNTPEGKRFFDAPTAPRPAP